MAASQNDKTSPQRLPRVSIHLPLEIGVGDSGVVIEAESANISRSGVFVETTYPLQVGSELTLQLAYDGTDETTVAIARVVRHQTDRKPIGYGMRFIELTNEAAHLIDRLCADEKRLG